MQTQNHRRLFLTCVVHILSCLLFLKGFFPMKSYVPGQSTFSGLPTEPGWSSMSIHHRRGAPGLKPIVGKTVVMVIDALRADFVYGNRHAKDMPFLQELLRTGAAVGHIGTANLPTVTLPRIKAITTGTIPSFVDVILNFGSPDLRDDNIVSQSRNNRLKMVFYGDETWLSLFPDHFIRSEGTTSFFVNDFEEVDVNVTRNVKSELLRDDWDLMILHYLGLDHIGHVLGPHSPVVPSKLREMDDVINLIYSTMVSKAASGSRPPLLVVCGDHGMSDSGNHGGASPAETDVPVLFISPLFRSTYIAEPNRGQQIDILPTLSVLLGLPIPINNVGKIIPGVLSVLPEREELYLNYINARQVAHVAKQYSGSAGGTYLHELRACEEMHKDWLQSMLKIRNTTEMRADQLSAAAGTIVSSYRNAVDKFRGQVSVISTDFSVGVMCLSALMQWALLFDTASLISADQEAASGVVSAPRSPARVLPFLCTILYGIFSCIELVGAPMPWPNTVTIVFLSFIVLVWISVMLLTNMKPFLEKVMLSSSESKCWLSGIIFHSVSLASTSFIEEEHQTWYYFTTTFLAVILFHCIRHGYSRSELTLWWTDVNKIAFGGSGHRPAPPERQELSQVYSWEAVVNIGVLLVTFSLFRNWNRTGDKWAHLPDTEEFLNRPENKIWLSASFFGGVCLILLLRSKFHRGWPRVLLVVIGVTAYLHRAAMGSLIIPGVFDRWMPNATSLAKLVYLLLVCLCTPGIVHFKLSGGDASVFVSSLVSAWSLLAALLMRPHNIALLAVVVLQERLYARTAQHLKLSAIQVAAISSMLVQSSFFLQGNSNSLSRIDLTGGYVGLDAYQPFLVGILLSCSTYCLPVFWILSCFAMTYGQADKREIRRESETNYNVRSISLLLLVCRILVWSMFSVFAIANRYHLFVWSVFAPKLLFEGAWSVLYLFLIAFFEIQSALLISLPKTRLATYF